MKNGNFEINQPKGGLIGHRGVAGYAPENTLASIKAAKDMGLDWVEIDIRQAKNGDLVVFHDPTLERTTNGKGQILQHDIPMLKELDAGKWFSANFEGEKIPTIGEALDYIVKLGMSANLEIKCPPTTSKDQVMHFAQMLVQALQQHWPEDTALPLVSSYNLEFVKTYRKVAPGFPVGVLADRVTDKILELVKSTPNCTLHTGKRHITPQNVERISKEGVPLLIYTVNDRDLGKAFLDAGAFALFSDTPDIFLD